MKNNYSDIKEVFKILNNFAKILFSDDYKIDENKKIRIERMNGELIVNGKKTLYKQLQK